MEWVETTAKTIEAAKEQALDQLGVAEDDVEFDVLEEPKAGLFGLIRGEARLRARIRPTEVRPKVERRRGGRSRGPGGQTGRGGAGEQRDDDGQGSTALATEVDDAPPADGGGRRGRRRTEGRADDGARGNGRGNDRDDRRDDRSDDREPVEPAAVGAAAVAFMEGLVAAFGKQATVELDIDGTELEVRVEGDDLGLMIGPGGRTLLAIQDLVRVAAQRRLGDHETRLRVDVAGYRERRRAALERFARTVAEQVLETSSSRSLEPMPSADRKVIHDVLMSIDGVTSHSVGEDPQRRVVVTPA